MNSSLIIAAAFGFTAGVVVMCAGIILWIRLRRARRRVRMEKNAHQQRSEAEDRRRLLEYLAREVHSSLNAIAGYGERIQQDVQDTKLHYYAGLIQAMARNLSVVVDDAVVLTSDQEHNMDGEIPETRAPVDINTLITELTAVYQWDFERRGIICSLSSNPSPLPQVCVDGVRVRQILHHLLRHAVDSSSRGTVHIQLSWNKSTRDNGVLVVEITDSGSGQIESGSQGQTGSEEKPVNLGVAIARTLAEQLGGSLSVERIPGKGSTYRLQFDELTVCQEDENEIDRGRLPQAGRSVRADVAGAAETASAGEGAPAAAGAAGEEAAGSLVTGTASWSEQLRSELAQLRRRGFPDEMGDWAQALRKDPRVGAVGSLLQPVQLLEESAEAFDVIAIQDACRRLEAALGEL